MNLTQFKAALKRIYGTKALYRYDESAPTAEERAQTRELLPALREGLAAARLARMARRDELLADTRYRELIAAEQASQQVFENAQRLLRHFRVTILVDKGWCTEVRAEGDNMQDAVDCARKREGK